MVEVFKTNVRQPEQAERLITSLSEQFPDCIINMDMADCDKILRVESIHRRIKPEVIINFVRQAEIEIEVLPDI